MTKWTEWFAWYPVKTTKGSWRWLSTIQRRWDKDAVPLIEAKKPGWWIYRDIPRAPVRSRVIRDWAAA